MGSLCKLIVQCLTITGVYDGADRTYRLSDGGVGAALHRQGLPREHHARSRLGGQLGCGVQLRRMGTASRPGDAGALRQRQGAGAYAVARLHRSRMAAVVRAV